MSIEINGIKYVKNNSDFIDSLFKSTKTADGYYKETNEGLIFFDKDKNKIEGLSINICCDAKEKNIGSVDKYGSRIKYGKCDCFLKSMSASQELSKLKKYKKIKMVHGCISGKEIECRYWHCWAEFSEKVNGTTTEYVADFSSNNQFILEKNLYYKIAKVEEELNKYYSAAEIKKALKLFLE